MTVIAVPRLSATAPTSEDSHSTIRRIWAGVAPSSREVTNSCRRCRLPISSVLAIAIAL